MLVRPTNRRECKDGCRPCPWVSCRYHLAIDVKEDGTLTLNRHAFQDGEPAFEVLEHTCALDIADAASEPSLANVAKYLGMGRNKIQDTERLAKEKLRERTQQTEALHDFK